MQQKQDSKQRHPLSEAHHSKFEAAKASLPCILPVSMVSQRRCNSYTLKPRDRLRPRARSNFLPLLSILGFCSMH